jgi:hypothetical protein
VSAKKRGSLGSTPRLSTGPLVELVIATADATGTPWGSNKEQWSATERDRIGGRLVAEYAVICDPHAPHYTHISRLDCAATTRRRLQSAISKVNRVVLSEDPDRPRVERGATRQRQQVPSRHYLPPT